VTVSTGVRTYRDERADLPMSAPGLMFVAWLVLSRGDVVSALAFAAASGVGLGLALAAMSMLRDGGDR
jgi:hypothetical protein